MKSNQRGAAWPYLIVLLGLFVLSITAPRAWNRQRYAGPPLEQLLEDRSHDAVEPALPEVKAAAVPVKAVTEDNAWAISSKKVAPVVVTPLRAFGRRVIDPIVEFARRPTQLRTIPDLKIPKFETAEVTEAVTVWVLPEALLDALDRLAEHPEAMPWANDMTRGLRELHRADGTSRPTAELLGVLRDGCAPARLPMVEDLALGAEIQRARYALMRRLELWERVAEISDLTPTAVTAAASETVVRSTAAVTNRLGDVERLVASVSAGDKWREYLLIDQLRAASAVKAPGQDEQALAKEVLARLDARRLSASQRGFATRPEIMALSQELRSWVTEPVEMSLLLADVERFERTQLGSDAKQVAEDCRSLRFVGDDASRELGERIDLHYRNANIRLSLATAFLNRFVPQPSAVRGRVSDMIQGVPVEGQSTTFTRVAVKAIPDPRRIRLGMEASGIVSSKTTSDAGPATFYNKAEASFMVRKLVLFDPAGLRIWPAISEADSYYSGLMDVETNFDGVPLVGSLVRNFARSQHDEAQPLARREMESKVAYRARSQFDEEAGGRLKDLTEKVEADVMEPLRKMGLDPTALDMSTAADRITMRIRLAGETQLAAHTPRPRALSDSLASLQVHQSAINNLLESLDLAGREFNVPELYKWIGGKLQRPVAVPEDVPEDVIIRFAEADPIRVRCVDGQLELEIAVARLSHGKKRWRDFTVKTVYQPDVVALDGRLVRTGGIFLAGESVQGRAEFVLRSIFSKALSVDRPWRIVPEPLAKDPRMAGLKLTQFVVEDGWIGLAYGERAVPTDVARRPK